MWPHIYGTLIMDQYCAKHCLLFHLAHLILTFWTIILIVPYTSDTWGLERLNNWLTQSYPAPSVRERTQTQVYTVEGLCSYLHPDSSRSLYPISFHFTRKVQTRRDPPRAHQLTASLCLHLRSSLPPILWYWPRVLLLAPQVQFSDQQLHHHPQTC